MPLVLDGLSWPRGTGGKKGQGKEKKEREGGRGTNSGGKPVDVEEEEERWETGQTGSTTGWANETRIDRPGWSQDQASLAGVMEAGREASPEHAAIASALASQ